MEHQDDKKHSTKRIARRIDPDMLFRSALAGRSRGEVEFFTVPSDEAAHTLDAPWRMILVHVEDPSRRVGLIIYGDFVIGSTQNDVPDVHVNLLSVGGDEAGVSARHVKVKVREDRLLLIDMNSTNGTHINGTLLTADRIRDIQDGDMLSLGRLHFRVHLTKVEVPVQAEPPDPDDNAHDNA